MPPQRKGLVDRIRHFIPSWFAVIMGTGIIGILIDNLPYGNKSARGIVSLAFLIINACLFVGFTAASVARYIMFPRIFSLMIREPVQSLFLSCFPMALSTIISASVSLSQNRTDLPGLLPFLWSMWWIESALAIASCILLPYIMITRHTHSLEQQSAIWLLPVVPPIVSASCGGVLAGALIDYSPSKATVTVAISCLQLATGLALSTMLTTTYLLRLIAHGFPKAGLVVSVFLPIGALGQGGFALLILSRHFGTLISATGVEGVLFSKIAIAIATCGALVLWSIGLWFAIISSIGILEVVYRSSVPFKVNFWGMIFPWGVYSLLTLQLGNDLNLNIFRVLGTIFSGFTILLWAVIAAKTSYLAIGGSIFHAPCLDDAPLLAQWPPRTTQEDEPSQLTPVGQLTPVSQENESSAR